VFQKVIGQKPDPAASSAGPARKDTPAPAQSTSSTSRQATAASSPSGRNVLSSDVEIKGSIKFSNDLVVDGKIEGNIGSDGSLTVGENARIRAEIKTRSVIIYGKVHGNIEVIDKVELKANAELVGDIKAASLSIEPGAIFVGKSTVGTPSVKPQPNSGNKPSGNQGNNPSSNQGGSSPKGGDQKSSKLANAS